jgi:SsrA-binding protein
MAAKKKQDDRQSKAGSPRIVNRRARHEYHILESLEVGIVLRGSEVKSVRAGQVSLAEGYARVDANTRELWLHDVNIAEYSHAHGIGTHEPATARKLLAHKRQIDKLLTETSSKGVTLIPLTLYFVRGMVKLEIGLARGKQQYDKRQSIKSRDADRQIRRAMTRKRI